MVAEADGGHQEARAAGGRDGNFQVCNHRKLPQNHGQGEQCE